MIIKITPDKQKASSLKQTAEITLTRLNTTNMEEYPSNTLIDYYCVLHKLMETITLNKGIKIKGEGAHKELINYVSKEYKLDEGTTQFLQQIRDYRNQIAYEGFQIHKNYIVQNNSKIRRIIEILLSK